MECSARAVYLSTTPVRGDSIMVDVPESETEAKIIEMLKQSQHQYRHNIKAIIKTKRKESKTRKEKCTCPHTITTKKRNKKNGTITFRPKVYNGYQNKCPIHSIKGITKA